MGGIPWILWRHVAWEVFRTFVVTTSIIVTVIAFGAAAKPLADNSIGADTVLKYVSLAMVPMLQYAMPFAAGFAATLAMHRFATDNEVTAMSAVGMSTRMVLAPVFLLGLPLFAVMLALVMYLIPHFWLRMQELATADATQMLVASIERGQALKADRLMIYADSVREAEAPEGVRRRLHLEGVAAVELSPKGGSAVETEFTAEAATVDVHATSRGTVVKVVLLDATVFRPAEGALVTVPRAEPEAAAVYGTFDRGPKFLSPPASPSAPRSSVAATRGTRSCWPWPTARSIPGARRTPSCAPPGRRASRPDAVRRRSGVRVQRQSPQRPIRSSRWVVSSNPVDDPTSWRARWSSVSSEPGAVKSSIRPHESHTTWWWWLVRSSASSKYECSSSTKMRLVTPASVNPARLR